MAGALEGKQIIITGSRKTEEMAALIEKRGGAALVRPMQGTVFLAEQELEEDLRALAENGADWVVFTTSAGLEALVAQAGKLGIGEEFMHVMNQAKIAARGYKTLAALNKLEMIPAAVDDDGTTQGLIHALEAFDFAGQRVAVQLHGEPSPALVGFFEGRGAEVEQLLPYRHIPPAEETAEKLFLEIDAGIPDAVCFTTGTQVRNLFRFAEQTGRAQLLRQALEDRVLAVAVGKVTAEALRDEGVSRQLMPENERMGAMVVELVQYFEKHGRG